jgi:hypothetical protein
MTSDVGGNESGQTPRPGDGRAAGPPSPAHVFVSHSSRDAAFASRLVAALEAAGVACWVAPRDIPAGADYASAIMGGLAAARMLVLVYSRHSVESEHVRREVERAVSRNVPVVPVRLEAVPPSPALEYMISSGRWVDAFPAPPEQHAAKVVEVVHRGLGGGAGASSREATPAESEQDVADVAMSSWMPPVPRLAARQRSTPDGGGQGDEGSWPPGTPPRTSVGAVGRRVASKSLRWLLRRVGVDLAHHVDCSVYGPRQVPAGSVALVQVFLHKPDQLAAASQAAREFDDRATRRGCQSLSIPLHPRDEVTVGLRVPGCVVEDPVQRLTWPGRPVSAVFAVRVPRAHASETVVGTAFITRGGCPLGHVKFAVKIVPGDVRGGPAPRAPIGRRATRYRRAFVCYASTDRVEVLKRVQVLRSLRIRVAQDLLTLKPGERWEQSIRRWISRSDVFLLFWSTAARQSEWVTKEVRHAISCQGVDGSGSPEILPVMLEGPPPPPPPDELAHLHFNDPLSYMIASGPGT